MGNNHLMALSVVYVAILLQVVPQIVLSVVFCYALIRAVSTD